MNQLDPFEKDQIEDRIGKANKAEKLWAKIKGRKVITEYDKKRQSADLRRLKRLQQEMTRPIKKK